jgi:hypothetical protein
MDSAQLRFLRQALSISERRACAALGQHRSTQRKIPRGREDEEQLTKDLCSPDRGTWPAGLPEPALGPPLSHGGPIGEARLLTVFSGRETDT